MYHVKNSSTNAAQNQAVGRSVRKAVRQAELTQHFLDVVKDTLEKCEGVSLTGLVDDKEKVSDIALLFHTYDNEFLEIGYARDGMYFLDSDFIYNRFCFYKTKETLHYDKLNLYAELLKTGILFPRRKGKADPLHKVNFTLESNKTKYVKYICVSSSYVDFNMDSMKVH